MKEIVGNIFDPNLEADAICVTTNGVVKANGELVMGAGIAKQFAERIPGIAKYLGEGVSKFGNIPLFGVGYDGTANVWFFSFPTKNNWRDQSDLELIENSARRLVTLVDEVTEHYKQNKFKKIILPRPGCGLGGLKWADVKKVIEPILDDRFYIITPGCKPCIRDTNSISSTGYLCRVCGHEMLGPK